MMSICEKIASQLSDMLVCADNGNGSTRVLTPFQYPDGGSVDVYVLPRGDGFTITDYGSALQWLHTISGSSTLSDNQETIVDDVCMTHRLDFYQGMLVIRNVSAEELADAVIRLSTAIVRVADVHYTFRPKPMSNFKDEFASFVGGLHLGYERNFQIHGRSGRRYRVDFKIEGRRPLLVEVLWGHSRGQVSSKVAVTATTWMDLKGSHDTGVPQDRLTVFDDRANVWEPSDFRLVGDLSEVFVWTEQDRIKSRFAA